jgi:hypothetical protein
MKLSACVIPVALFASLALAGCASSHHSAAPAPTVTVTVSPTPAPSVTPAAGWTPETLAATCVTALNEQTPSAGFTMTRNQYEITASALSDYSVEVRGTAAVGGPVQDCQISGTVTDPKIEIGLGADGS